MIFGDVQIYLISVVCLYSDLFDRWRIIIKNGGALYVALFSGKLEESFSFQHSLSVMLVEGSFIHFYDQNAKFWRNIKMY